MLKETLILGIVFFIVISYVLYTTYITDWGIYGVYGLISGPIGVIIMLSCESKRKARRYKSYNQEWFHSNKCTFLALLICLPIMFLFFSYVE